MLPHVLQQFADEFNAPRCTPGSILIATAGLFIQLLLKAYPRVKSSSDRDRMRRAVLARPRPQRHEWQPDDRDAAGEFLGRYLTERVTTQNVQCIGRLAPCSSEGFVCNHQHGVPEFSLFGLNNQSVQGIAEPRAIRDLQPTTQARDGTRRERTGTPLRRKHRIRRNTQALSSSQEVALRRRSQIAAAPV